MKPPGNRGLHRAANKGRKEGTLKRIIVLTIAVTSLALGGLASAEPTTGPEPGPGCFGQWRAGSVQALNESGLGPVGLNFFAERAGDNASINASNRAPAQRSSNPVVRGLRREAPLLVSRQQRISSASSRTLSGGTSSTKR
jgi:hypothetical protein